MDNTKEYIICAAIHYKISTRFIVHQPKNIHDGVVICGRRHHNIIEIASKLADLKIDNLSIQGFMTSKDRFVDRIEALQIAKDCKQIPNNSILKRLHSEDIY